jgi:hypothetical protein
MSFFTTFNPNNLQNGTLSNGNLTFTQSGSTIGGCRADVQLAFGLHYIEFTINSFTNAGSNSHGVGFAQYGTSFASIGNSVGGFLIYFNNGDIWVNAVYSGITFGALANGDVIRAAINYTTKLGWFARNSGNWNNSGTANPATNTGGIALSILPNYLTPVAVGQISTTDSITLNAGASAFTFAVPAGYTSGWSSVDALPYWDFRSIRRKIYYWDDPVTDDTRDYRINHRLARTTWAGSHAAIQVSKFIQYAVLAPQDGAINISKFVQYAVLAPQDGAINISKFVQFVVMDGTPYTLVRPRRRRPENKIDENVHRKRVLYNHSIGGLPPNNWIQTFVIT